MLFYLVVYADWRYSIVIFIDLICNDCHLSVLDCGWHRPRGIPKIICWRSWALRYHRWRRCQWTWMLRFNGMVSYFDPDLKKFLFSLIMCCMILKLHFSTRWQIKKNFLWRCLLIYELRKCNSLFQGPYISCMFSQASSRYRSSIRWYRGAQLPSQGGKCTGSATTSEINCPLQWIGNHQEEVYV